MRRRSGKLITICLLAIVVFFAPGAREGPGAQEGPQWIEEREFPPEPPSPVKTILTAPFYIPEFLLGFVAWPVLKFLEYEDEYVLVQRGYDLVSNDDHTVFHYPYAYFSTGGEFIFGAAYSDSNVFHRKRKFKLAADSSTSGDRSASVSFERPGDVVSPLFYSVNIGYGKNGGNKFYGIGNGTDRGDKSVFLEESVDFSLEVGRKFRPLPFFKPSLRLGYVSEKTGASPDRGTSTSIDEVFDADTLAGFGESLDFFQYGLSLLYDSRIPFHGPYRGRMAELSVLRADSVDGSPYGYTTYHLGFTQLFNLYRGNRVLALGFQFETTEGHGDEIPFNHLSRLDRDSPLRGFAGNRFTDRGFLLFNLEYSYPVWRTESPGIASMVGTFFFDAGKTFGSLSEYDEGKLHYSGGTGLAVIFPGDFYLRLQAAYGGEGVQFVAAFDRSF